MTTLNPLVSTQVNPSNPWVGIDIGGANLKAAHSSGWCESVSFPMWKRWRELGKCLADLLEECPPINGIAVTMTGELADCFATRAQGVAIILEQLTSIMPACMIQVYGVDGQWRSVSQSAREPWRVAASNWHGLARYVSHLMDLKNGLLIDIGSTTSDLIPICNGAIAIDATTDSQRLQSGSLVYTGVERSNVIGIVNEVTLFGRPCPLMNEQFATTRDVYLWLHELQDEIDNVDTADCQPATRQAARFRLARVVGEDGSTLTDGDIDQIAAEISRKQTLLISSAIQQVWNKVQRQGAKPEGKKLGRGKSASATPLECVVLSGHGDFLIEAALAVYGWDGHRLRLSEWLGPDLSRCAPAYAIAALASKELVLQAQA